VRVRRTTNTSAARATAGITFPFSVCRGRIRLMGLTKNRLMRLFATIAWNMRLLDAFEAKNAPVPSKSGYRRASRRSDVRQARTRRRLAGSKSPP
jgi:hypothetical protein